MTEAAKAQPAKAPNVNEKQNAEIEALKAEVATLKELLTSQSIPARAAAPKPIPSAEQAREAVLKARSKKPRTYRALMDGVDIRQGIVKAGETFTTTQPQGSWMELVDADEADEAEG